MAVKSLVARGLSPLLVEEIRRRVMRGRIVDDRVNILPGRVFVDDPGSDGDVWRLIIDAGIALPGDSGPMLISKAAVLAWQVYIDEEGERLRRDAAPRPPVAPCMVGDEVMVFMPGAARFDGICVAVGTRYVRVKMVDSGRLMQVRFGAVALKNNPLLSAREGISEVEGLAQADSASGFAANQRSSRSRRQRRRRVAKRMRSA
jgi:hypothetical protein